ncbi:MATE family efflux transporter [Treponema berlinense]|uniref:MATE family efflux transporter n=1 Tax=Treponema berlinense TaxID=225004 RepID=UPI0023521591|nr:MATE family efflux transporter [Treponema berlinense]
MEVKGRQLFQLLVPLMVEQLLNSFMGTADTVMITKCGSAAISAVSLVDSINVMVVLIFSAMATGGAILCSQYLGRKDIKQACHAGKQLILSVTFVSIVGTAILILFKKSILSLIFGSVEAEVMSKSEIYFFITALSYPFIAIYNSGAAIFRADGNSKLPMVVSTISNILNIVGNAIFIFGFNMSVAGAALSTLISRIFCAVVILILLNRTKQQIAIDSYLAKPDFREISQILRIGIPSGIENGMFQFGKLAIQSSVSTLGTATIAANALTSVLESFSSQAPIGIGIALMTLAGQAYGAGNYKLAEKYIKKLTFFSFIAVAISSVIVIGIVKPLTVLSGMDADVALLTIQLSVFVHVIKPFAWSFSFIPPYGMRATGDVRFPMLVSTVTMWTCRVALTIFLIRVLKTGPLGVWIGMSSDWVIRSVIFFFRFKSGKYIHRTAV